MLPQLATGTFASQIFWMVVGFVCVYVFLDTFASPKLKKILDSRENCVRTATEEAKMLKSEADVLVNETSDLLQRVRTDILREEAIAVADIDKGNQKQKRQISDKISKKVNSEREALKASSKEIFEEISENLDELLDLAAGKICKK